MNWISVKDRKPPKDEPFLAATEDGVEKVFFSVSDYVGYYSCNCCRNKGCTIESFEFWMPLPEKPKKYKEVFMDEEKIGELVDGLGEKLFETIKSYDYRGVEASHGLSVINLAMADVLVLLLKNTAGRALGHMVLEKFMERCVRELDRED